MENDLKILMASDDNYVFLLANTIYSLFINNQKYKNIFVYLIDINISKPNKNKLNEIAKKFKRDICYLKPPLLPQDLQIKGSLNLSTYYRLFICEILPKNINKILYIDCDVLVRGSLNDLWNININNYLLAGIQDTTGSYSRMSIELDKNDDYINAGVMLINLKAWRDIDLQNKFIEYLKCKKFKVEFNDQGVINRLCNNNILLLSPKYNYMAPYDRYNKKQLEYIIEKEIPYNKEEIEEAKNNPVIVHFAGYAFTRPWYKDSSNRFKEEFVRNLMKCGFGSCANRNQPNNLKYKIRRVVNKTPDSLCIFLNKLIDKVYILTQK